MNKFSRPVCIVVLACLPVIGILYAKSPVDSQRPKQKVLVEAMIVQISGDTLDKLQIGRSVEPSSKVTVPLATLLYILADPNAVKTIAHTKLVVLAGHTATSTNQQKVKYLVERNDGSFEQKTSEMSIGTELQAAPVIDKDGDILLDFKFKLSSAASPKEIDPQTALPIGRPMIGITSTNSRLKLKPGVPMIAGGIEKSAALRFVLVRAEILK